MPIPTGWTEKSMVYLKKAIEDWVTALSLPAGTEVVVGKGDRSGTVTAPIIYLLDLEGHPRYNSDTFLIVGHRIKFKYAEVQLSDATAQLTKTLDSLIDWLDQCVVFNTPVIATAKPPWLGSKISDPVLVEINSPTKGYLSNEAYLDVEFKVPFFRRVGDYPQAPVD